MATFSIAAGADDGHAKTDGTNYTNSQTYVLFGNGDWPAHAFLRFQNVTIPAGATITSAILRFTSRWSDSANTVNLNLYFEAADNPSAPTDGTDLLSRSLTSAVAWSALSGWVTDSTYDSPELKTILQEVIDRPGWSSGQAVIAYVIDNSSSAFAYRAAKSYEQAPADVVDLIVTYEFQGDISEGIGLADDVDAFNLTDELSEGIGLADDVDAFNLTDELSEGLGLADEIDAFNSSGWLDEGIGLADDVDATRESFGEISEGIGLADLIDATPEWNVGISEGLGLADSIDALNWAQWLRANKDKSIERYFFTLTGSADSTTDIEIPIASFQARKRTGESTYLKVIIKDYATYAAAVTARANGEMIIELGYEIAGEIVLREEILRADLEDIELYRGGNNRSIALTGHKTITYAAQAVTVENPTYKAVTSGRITYRFNQCDPYLNPGDTCTVGADSFTVDYIIYMVSPNFKTMEVRET